jgi:hypothetical protein
VDEPPITEYGMPHSTHRSFHLPVSVCAYKQVGPTYSNTAIKRSVDIIGNFLFVFVCTSIIETTRPPRHRKIIPATVPTNLTTQQPYQQPNRHPTTTTRNTPTYQQLPVAIPDPLRDHSLQYSGKMNSGKMNLFFPTTTQGDGSLTEGGTLYRE